MGLLINFEGIDRSGKDTQIAAVMAALRESGLKVAFVNMTDRPNGGEAQPRHFPTGVLLERYLRDVSIADGRDQMLRHPMFDELEELLDGEFGAEYAKARVDSYRHEISAAIDGKLAQMLFSINRRERTIANGGLADLLATNDVVVVSRYLSAFAYGVASGVSRVQINFLEGDLPQPDLTILLDLDPAAAAGRRPEDAHDRYEADVDFQREVRRLYNDMARDDAADAEEEGRAPHFVKIDAGLAPEAITAQILATINERREAAK